MMKHVRALAAEPSLLAQYRKTYPSEDRLRAAPKDPAGSA